MRPLPLALPPALLLSLPFALSACADPAPLYVDQAWISASSDVTKQPSAGYLVIHGGETDSQLRAVQADTAQRIEMHDSVMAGGMMTMKSLDSVDVPAKSSVAFAPGGRHLMIFGLNPGAVKMGKTQLTLTFSNGDRIIVDAVIRKQGEAPPSAPEHGDH